MPPFPKICNRGSQIGQVKILHQGNAHGSGYANGHVGIAAEVAVNLKCEEQRGQCQSAARMSFWVGIHGININGQTICDDHFLKQTPYEQLSTLNQAIVVESLNHVQLRQDVARSFDWTRYQLREECHKGHEIDQRLLALDATRVDVDTIAQGLKTKELYADR
jgi:hypothetical protein